MILDLIQVNSNHSKLSVLWNVVIEVGFLVVESLEKKVDNFNWVS
jgi:hypothetical protein